jgi:hypothetical protein
LGQSLTCTKPCLRPQEKICSSDARLKPNLDAIPLLGHDRRTIAATHRIPRHRQRHADGRQLNRGKWQKHEPPNISTGVAAPFTAPQAAEIEAKE